jgi:hypothetical protein
MADGGYQVDPVAVGGIVTNVDGMLCTAGGTVDELASTTLDGSAYATIGSPVAAAGASLHGGLVDGFSQAVQLVQGLNAKVGTAATGYATADQQVAAAFGATTQQGAATPTTTTAAPKFGPGGTNEVPLPPWHTEDPEVNPEGYPSADDDTYALMRWGAVPWMEHKGWTNAAGLFQHYLDNTGTDYTVDPGTLMHDVPSFQQAVDGYVGQQQTPGHFDSGWTNFGTDVTDAQGNLVSGSNGKLAQDSMDWYYGLHHWRYDVSGDTTLNTDGSTSTNYTVQLFKPYVFHGADLNLPGGISDLTGLKFPQSMIQHLNTVGMARNFNVVGSGTFTTTTPAPTP